MARSSLVIILVFLSISGCEEIDPSTPDCMRAEIREFKNSAMACKSGASVDQYEFQGESVFVFNPGECIRDGGAKVLNEACEEIGSLGGIHGLQIVYGIEVDFYTEAIFIQRIWEN